MTEERTGKLVHREWKAGYGARSEYCKFPTRKALVVGGKTVAEICALGAEEVLDKNIAVKRWTPTAFSGVRESHRGNRVMMLIEAKLDKIKSHES